MPGFCGPKLSLCCLLISIWGIVMLTVMGICLRVRAPAFIEDLPIDDEEWARDNHSPDYINNIYSQVSTNCFIAAGMYVGTFVLSAVMYKVNQRQNYQAN